MDGLNDDSSTGEPDDFEVDHDHEVELRISDAFKSLCVERLKGYLPSEITLRPSFERAVSLGLDELSDLSTFKVCQARQQGLGLSCDPEDLAERILKTPSGVEFVAGARFKNLDIEFPFVEIHMAVPMTEDRLKELEVIVLREFESLNPIGLMFKDQPDRHPCLEKWSHTLFGKIKSRAEDLMPPKMLTSWTSATDWHSQYVLEYQERLRERPELVGYVRVGEIEEFKASSKDRALMLLTDECGFCGVVSGVNRPIYGLPSLYMIESYLSKRWIGKGLAPSVHAEFLNRLSPRFQYVWGTIFDLNLPSLRTAQRMGRQIVETEYFYRFKN